MGVVPSVMQVLGFEAQESAHPFELALAREALSLESAEQLPGVDNKYASLGDQLRQNGSKPIYRCLDGF